MRIISSTGYGASGSTAVADLIGEYSNVEYCTYNGKPTELKLFYSTRSIFSLYYYLVLSHPYYSVMHFAATDFYNQCREWAGTYYEEIFKGRFMEFSELYLKELGGSDYFYSNLYRDLDYFEKRKLKKMVADFRNKGITFKGENYKETSLEKKEIKYYMYNNITEEEFASITKNYFMNLMRAFCQKEFAGFHTLIPITSIDECTRFFDDICVIASNRDPRDIYLTEKRILRKANYPSYNVETFCKFQKWIRERVNRPKNSEVLFIQFEDLVYRYDETKKKIEDFTGLKALNHTKNRTRFIPERSAMNCNLKEKFLDEKDNIEYIEKELADYLFDF